MPLEPEEPFQNPPLDIQLPEKTVAQLNNIDPYDEDVWIQPVQHLTPYK